ncbi:MAG: hypothetical protein QOF42_3100 [Gammaproteobacteria bacterium]|nr:hypothetical protein [Gammaproteobacteria bacterium]
MLLIARVFQEIYKSNASENPVDRHIPSRSPGFDGFPGLIVDTEIQSKVGVLFDVANP